MKRYNQKNITIIFDMDRKETVCLKICNNIDASIIKAVAGLI